MKKKQKPKIKQLGIFDSKKNCGLSIPEARIQYDDKRPTIEDMYKKIGDIMDSSVCKSSSIEKNRLTKEELDKINNSSFYDYLKKLPQSS